MTFTVVCTGQVNDKSIRQKVLNTAIIDSTFIFGKWTENGGTETHLTFLGQVTTNKRQTFKLVNSIYYWGLSHRATSRILVFNNKNEYIGNYRVTMTNDLPTKMENEKLIFHNSGEECDKNLVTTIDLNKGLPKQFFRKCKESFGDIYSFDNE
jgi:hypothetical protein